MKLFTDFQRPLCPRDHSQLTFCSFSCRMKGGAVICLLKSSGRRRRTDDPSESLNSCTKLYVAVWGVERRSSRYSTTSLYSRSLSLKSVLSNNTSTHLSISKGRGGEDFSEPPPNDVALGFSFRQSSLRFAHFCGHLLYSLAQNGRTKRARRRRRNCKTAVWIG